jgi:nitroimidazol reductase NimA-like FMN-containing flavoprotein (pyridoxamine 5'-phosphate oxidase superfamily)
MADHAAVARDILDTNSFMTLATADADGLPWASPVWFAQENYRELYWVSAPDSRHSRNLAVRPELSIVVFDSAQTPGDVQAVYMSATAGQLDDVEAGIEVYSRVSARSGLPGWGVERVTGGARLRLYRATVTEHHIMDPDAPVDVRLAVTP